MVVGCGPLLSMKRFYKDQTGAISSLVIRDKSIRNVRIVSQHVMTDHFNEEPHEPRPNAGLYALEILITVSFPNNKCITKLCNPEECK